MIYTSERVRTRTHGDVAALTRTAFVRYSGWYLMSAVTSPARQDYFVRISPNQVLCEICGCSKPASFILHRYAGAPKAAALAYCEDHGKKVGRDLGILIPCELE